MPLGSRCVVAVLVSVTLAVSSCSRERRPRLHPVRGSVTFQKKPAVKAVVVLRPVKPGALKDTLPNGVVGSDGTFVIGTYSHGDGAPAGEYVVTITWPEARTDSAGDEVSTDRLQGKFADSTRSPWTVVVREGNNELEPFQLD